MRKIAWLTLTLLMVAALVLSSCQAATVEEEKKTETVAGKVTEKEAAKVEEEEVVEEEVEAGPEMVRDVKGRLVEKPQYGGTVVKSTAGNPSGWDPWMTQTGGSDYLVMGAVYEQLMGADWSADRSECDFTGYYYPFRCTTGYSMESYEHPDPLTYIVHIRKGMRFWNKPPVNGREVTADDFKFCFDREQGWGEFAEDGKSPYYATAFWEQNLDPTNAVEVVDKYTFIFHLKNPAPSFPEYWGMIESPWVYPRELVDTYGSGWTWEDVVGHGPWMIEDLVFDSSITYVKNPNYYGVDGNFPDNHIPYADRFKVPIIPDWSTRMAALRTGKIDQLPMGWEDGLMLQETDPQLNWVKTASICRAVEINNGKEPYTDIRVRKAMQMAINIPELAEAYYGGTADPYPFMAHPKVHPDYWTPLEELPEDCQEAFTFDPEGAKALLADAGYPNGFKQVMPLSGPWDLADLFIAYWEGIGIETEIRLMEGAAYSDFIYSGNADMVWIWSCGYWMPTQIYEYWYGGQETVPWNFSNANDPIFNQYRKDILANPDAAERTRLIKEGFMYGVGQYFYTAGPVQVANVAWQPWLKGYQGEDRITSVAFGPTWARVWIDQDLKFEMTGARD